MKSKSIVRQLVVSTLLTLVATWIFVISSVFWVIKHETDEIFDSSLQETAQRLLPLAIMQLKIHDSKHQGNDVIIKTDDSALEPTNHNEYLVYQVFNKSGHMLLHSHTAPDSPLVTDLKPGFKYTDDHLVYVEKSRNGEFFLALAEKLNHRRDAWTSTIKYLLTPLFALLPLSAFFILIIAFKARKPLLSLDHQMALRGSSDLHPLELEALPTELKPLAKTLNQLMFRLKSALEAERNFTANSAHELRTPLAAAMAQLSVLEKTALSERQLETLHTTQSSLYRLQALSEKLLQLARAESGVAWKRIDIDLNQLITLIAGDHQWRSQNHLELHTPKTPVIVQGDIDAIGIVLNNLIENAIKYSSPESHIKVELSVQPIQISIYNDCEPLPAEVLARLRERFFRARPDSHGAGLGLSIVNAILQCDSIDLSIYSPPTHSNRGFEAKLTWP